MLEPARLLQQANDARRLAAALTDPGAYYILIRVAAECEALATTQNDIARSPPSDGPFG
jgi:hypothetical protein